MSGVLGQFFLSKSANASWLEWEVDIQDGVAFQRIFKRLKERAAGNLPEFSPGKWPVQFGFPGQAQGWPYGANSAETTEVRRGLVNGIWLERQQAVLFFILWAERWMSALLIIFSSLKRWALVTEPDMLGGAPKAEGAQCSVKHSLGQEIGRFLFFLLVLLSKWEEDPASPLLGIFPTWLDVAHSTVCSSGHWSIKWT